jgi:hypothetical protein
MVESGVVRIGNGQLARQLHFEHSSESEPYKFAQSASHGKNARHLSVTGTCSHAELQLRACRC